MMNLKDLVKWCDSRGIVFEFNYRYPSYDHGQMILKFKDVVHDYQMQIDVVHDDAFWKELEEYYLLKIDHNRLNWKSHKNIIL